MAVGVTKSKDGQPFLDPVGHSELSTASHIHQHTGHDPQPFAFRVAPFDEVEDLEGLGVHLKQAHRAVLHVPQMWFLWGAACALSPGSSSLRTPPATTGPVLAATLDVGRMNMLRLLRHLLAQCCVLSFSCAPRAV